MKLSKYLVVLVLVINLQPLYAQQVLSVDEVMATFLANNFEVRLAENEVKIAALNASKTNAGFYPRVNVSGSGQGDVGHSRQTFRDGSVIEADNNFTRTYGATAGVNYTLYQGGERRYNLERLRQVVSLMDLQKQNAIESGLVQVLNTYYTAAQAWQQWQVLEEAAEFSEEKLNRSRTNYELGRGTHLDVLSDESDLQRDMANALTGKISYEQLKRELVRLMGVDMRIETFDVSTEVNSELVLAADELIDEAIQKNIQMALIAVNEDLIDHETRIVNSQKRPTLGLSADYGVNYIDFGDAGFFVEQSGRGLGAGLNFSWNIFNGGRLNQQLEVLSVRRAGLGIQQEQTIANLKIQIQTLYDNHRNALRLAEIENLNVELAKKVLERALKEYESGRIGSVEVRQAQLNLLRAQLNYQIQIYDAKRFEVQLLQLSGRLLT